MLLVLCVDLDDDIGRKTGVSTPVVGRDAVEDAAVALATTDPEDSDSNVLFEGVHLYDELLAEGSESAEVAAVTGTEGSDVVANRAVGEEIDTVLAGLTTGEDVRAIVVTDGAQDESVVPVIRSRIDIDGVRRVVVRQAEDLESMYYTIKQVLDDPETRGAILVPLGIILLIYPLAVLADVMGMPGDALGVASGLLGLYLLSRGLGLGTWLDAAVERARSGLYAGRVTIVTYVVALTLLVIGGASGFEMLTAVREEGGMLGAGEMIAAVVAGSIHWLAAAGITSSLGQVTDEYLAGAFRFRYLNAPFYILAIAGVVHAVSLYVLGRVDLSYLAMMLTAGTLLGLFSTLAFAIAESRLGEGGRRASA